MVRKKICALFLIFLANCYSTRFIPPNDNRIYLIMVEGEEAFVKNGKIFKFGEKISEVMDCDKEAKSVAIRAEENYRKGRIYGNIAIFYPIVGIPLVLGFNYTITYLYHYPPVPLEILSLSLISSLFIVSPVFITLSETKMEEAKIGFIDAMNKHNSSSACVHGKVATGPPIWTELPELVSCVPEAELFAEHAKIYGKRSRNFFLSGLLFIIGGIAGGIFIKDLKIVPPATVII